MVEKQKRDFLDWAGTLALPAVIGLGGLLYSCHKDDADRSRVASDKAAEATRQEWDRDAALVKELTSSNDREQQYASLMIHGLISVKRFPEDLIPVMNGLSQGRPSDPVTQVAKSFKAGAIQASTPTASAANKSLPIRVYVQYAKECERQEVEVLQTKLGLASFQTPPAELVPLTKGGTTRTYVRFFTPLNSTAAQIVNKMVSDLGFHPTVQDFSKSHLNASNEIEVWIGDSEEVDLAIDDKGGVLESAPGVALRVC